METFELRTLGEFAFCYAGAPLPTPPTKKARALLAYLVMHRTTDVSREGLLERFWPDFEPERARDNLKVTLWSVRRAIRSANVDANDVIRADRTIVRWLAPIDFDVERFGSLCADASGDGATSRALAIYRGDFLDGDYDEWAAAQRERLSAQYEALLSRTVAASSDVAAAEALIGRNPYDEAAYATLAAAELRAGRPQAAALLVERCRAALAEMGAEPTAEFERSFGTLRPAESASATFRLPFVARDRELAELERRLADTARGSGSVSVVHGDAGIGKSSVLAQLALVAAPLGVPIVELRCKGRETETLDEWRPLYEALTGRSLAEAIGAAGSSATGALARELATRLHASPTVLVVDDAQHLSGESFTLLVELVRSACEASAIVLATRPEGVARLRTALHECRHFADVRLGPLSDAALASALRQGSGNDLPELARAVFERTKGHPLYAVETISALVENGTLTRGERGWHLSGALDESLPVPSTMRAFIEGRLTARGSVPASVASALALEPAASATDLGRALAMDETTLLDALDDLLSLGLIVPDERGAHFAFSHDLVHEAAAAMLNAGRRVRLHAAFARDLTGSSERNATIRRARHLVAAGQPLAAAGDFLSASRRAQRAGLARDALDRASEGIAALALVDESRERDRPLAALERETARGSFALLDLDAATTAIDAAIALVRSLSDPHELAESLLLRSQIASVAEPPVERVARARDAVQAARIAGDAGSPTLADRALVELAAARRENGERSDALATATEAFDAAVAAERWSVARRAGDEAILTCATWWDFSHAVRWVSRTAAVAARAGAPAQAAHRATCALLWYLLDRDDEAENELAVARELTGDESRSSAIVSDALVETRAFAAFVAAVAARAREDGAAVLRALDGASGSAIVELPARAAAFAMIRIDGLLLRGEPGDDELAREACDRLPERWAVQSAFGLSACPELTRACVAARRRDANASRALRSALDAVEEHARRTPLGADAAFARLEHAARAADTAPVAVRAAERSAYFHAQRRAAAGGAWGGREG